jgi:branched-chain amino acid transport system permease protein
VGFLADLWATYQNLVYFLGIDALLALSVYATLAGGQLSLAQAAFMGIGAYTSALLSIRAHAPFAVSLAAGALLPALIALPLGLPVLRLRGVFLAIATIGFGEVMRIIALNAVPLTGGALGLPSVPNTTRLWHIILVLGVTLYGFWRLRGSRPGYALEAIREDETAARGLGIDVTAYKLTTFVAGAVIAGLAGGLAAHATFFIGPNDYGFERAVTILSYAIVGGVGTFWGPVAGSTALTLLPEVLRAAGVPAGWVRLLLNGVILVAVILFAPNGLAGLARGRRGARLGTGVGIGSAAPASAAEPAAEVRP